MWHYTSTESRSVEGQKRELTIRWNWTGRVSMLFDGCGNLLGVPHLGILMSGSAWKLMFGAALARAFSSCDSHLSRLRVNERRRWGNLHLLKHNLTVRG